MTDQEKEIRRTLLEELIVWNLDQAQQMRKTIEMAGDHYTYRDKLRHHEAADSDLRQFHLYLLGYDESSKRLRALSNKQPKAKARDIIPGWPRGKSTIRPYPTSPPVTLWGCEPWLPCDVIALADELQANRRYHAGQQAMVDQFRQGGWEKVL